jgi:hypothetical protein
MELSIIIVNWNTSDLLKKCLSSIYYHSNNLNPEIIVIDNASKDESVEIVKRDFSGVKLIINTTNRGFAAAVNQGLRIAQGEITLLLNPDTEITKNTFNNSLKFIKENSSVGVLGCKILNPDGNIQPSCRRFPTLLSQIIILLKLHNFFPNLKVIRNYYMLNWPHNEIKEVDQVMGAFFMLRKDTVYKVGEFDENFFLWFEEVDYCKRVKEASLKVFFYPEAEIIHQKGKSFEKLPAIKEQIIMNKSLMYYFKKHGRKIDRFILLFFYPLSLFLSFLVELLGFFKIPIKKKRYL